MIKEKYKKISLWFTLIALIGACAEKENVNLNQNKLNDKSHSIGVAVMKKDGTIVLKLRAEGSSALGDGIISYAPDDENYDEVFKHLGGLKPGEEKRVPPWE